MTYSIFTKIFILFFLLGFLCWPKLSLLAAENASEKEKDDKQQSEKDLQLPEVIVYENKNYPELKHDEAASGTVLKRKDFDDAAETLPKVLEKQTGLRITRYGGPSAFSTLSIRGSNADQVLVVLDGIPLNSSSGGPVDLSSIPLGNLDRIEIYRGVAPIYFCNSSIGGVLSVTTRNGRKRLISIEAGGGSFASREARLFYAEPFKNFDVALGLDYSGWEGEFSFLNDNGTRFDETDDFTSKRKNNYYDQLNTLVKARFKLNSNYRLTTFDWLYFKRQGLAGYGLFETEKPKFVNVENLFAIKLEGMNLYKKLDFEATASLRYVHSRLSDPLSEIGLGVDNSKDNSYSPAFKTYLGYKAFNWLLLSFSVAYRFEYFDAGGASISAQSSSRHNLNASLESKFSIQKANLLIIPSARIEWAKSNLADNSISNASTKNEANNFEGSYRLALVNTSIPDTKLTISASRSVRLPSLFELFGNNGKVLGNANLKAESSYNADAGIIYQSTMLPAYFRLKLELYGFFSQVSNLIQFVQNSQNIAVAENLDKARLYGVEAGLETDLFRHLRLNANYTYLKTKNLSNISARKGKVLPNRPASKWYAKAEGYLNDIKQVDEISLFFDSEWVAGNFLDNANLVAVKSRFYFNAGLSFEFSKKSSRLSFTANNLTNEQTLDLTGYPVPGRSYHLLFTLKIF